MANNLDTNPVIIDTFDADITIRPVGNPLNITKVDLISADAGDKVTLEDGGGKHVISLEQVAGLQVDQSWNPPLFCNGLAFDANDGQSGLGSSDILKIYHK